jgi:hypothetical protein
MFTLNEISGLRGHQLKFAKASRRTEVRHQYFSNWVVYAWNGLDELTVKAPSLDTFKNRQSGVTYDEDSEEEQVNK